MLSLILYGRNDNYGYNLHKRAALSLNCMAELLDDEAEEILFVDYNTPNDYPTFPEAIQDTLTAKAKRHLRILRARPALHARFAGRTHLLALEPVARNIALRRANPANRWILSTNTDMIFVPRDGRGLGAILRDLPAGHYGIPRFEIPETLWEGLDRTDARGVIDSFARWGWDLHLNEIVQGMRPFRFDGPGDFQLMLREDLFRLHGFHEDMLLGWHVDANIAKRFSLVYGDVGDLSGELFGYHCDHTRQVTPAHRRDAAQNSVERFFTKVDRPDVPEQAESWGCPDETIEEIRLGSGNTFLGALNTVLRAPLGAPLVSAYVPESRDEVGYTPEHVLPFLLDLFASAPRGTRFGWFGTHAAMLDQFLGAWRALGGSGEILLPADRPALLGQAGRAGLSALPTATILAEADVLVFDFVDAAGGPLPHGETKAVHPVSEALLGIFMEAVLVESGAQADGAAPRRFVGINAIHNGFEHVFGSHVVTARTPFSVRLRHGFVVPEGMSLAADGTLRPTPQDWLRLMLPGPAGRQEAGALVSEPGEAGNVGYGPYLHPLPGRYALAVDFGTNDVIGAAAEATEPPLHRRALTAARMVLGDSATRRARHLVRDALGRERATWVRDRWIKASATDDRYAEVVLEVASEDTIMASRRLLGPEAGRGSVEMSFDVAPDLFLSPERDGIELRVHTNGLRGFRIVRVSARRVGPIPRVATQP
ncbi:hypothetical protein DFH01_03505 [Falsiroseomonas bella]|uniref:Uncharacterized protein n=1 Tax=Falsiroseomonas bella TaxID=2184016 RepID=A0A317FLA8_9PROT|nr:hypothetical protein [Falsiroseomonas bella]PWS38366.1 hypothetical protein DFH01_03505 [Falsiroseomonas bella]